MKAKSKKATDKSASSGDIIGDMVDALVAIGGEGTAQLLGSNNLKIKIRGVISTQCAPLDRAIGRGGIPLGRLSILHGPEGSGKTTLALHLVAETQQRGGIAIYIDKEYKLDPEYAAAIGVDLERLIISQPPYLEKAYELFEGAIKMAKRYRETTGKRVPILIVLDSMNATISKAEYEGEWEDKHMAASARVHSASLPKIIPIVSSEDVALLYISQVRSNMKTMPGANQDEIAGGKGPRFYASLIMKVANIGSVKDGENRVANETLVECRKNQIAPPFRKAQFEIRYGVGVDRVAALLDDGLSRGYVIQSGSFFKMHTGERIGQGREDALDMLRTDSDLRSLLEDCIAMEVPVIPQADKSKGKSSDDSESVTSERGSAKKKVKKRKKT